MNFYKFYLVAIDPATTSTFSYLFLISLTISIQIYEWPLAISTTITSTPALTSFSTLSYSLTPTAAPTYNYPFLSIFAFGLSVNLVTSLWVIKPNIIPCLSIKGIFQFSI